MKDTCWTAISYHIMFSVSLTLFGCFFIHINNMDVFSWHVNNTLKSIEFWSKSTTFSSIVLMNIFEFLFVENFYK